MAVKFNSKKLLEEVRANQKARRECSGHRPTRAPGRPLGWVCSVCDQKLDARYLAGYLDRIRHEGGDPDDYLELKGSS